LQVHALKALTLANYRPMCNRDWPRFWRRHFWHFLYHCRCPGV